MFICIPGIDSIFMLSLTTLAFVYFVISAYLAYDLCLFVDHDFCLALLKLVFFTICIWVPPSPSILTSLTLRTIEKVQVDVSGSGSGSHRHS